MTLPMQPTLPNYTWNARLLQLFAAAQTLGCTVRRWWSNYL